MRCIRSRIVENICTSLLISRGVEVFSVYMNFDFLVVVMLLILIIKILIINNNKNKINSNNDDNEKVKQVGSIMIELVRAP